MILVVGEGVWGGGDTFEKAMANCRKENRAPVRRYMVYEAPEGTRIDEMGRLLYFPEKGEPKLIKKIGFKKGF